MSAAKDLKASPRARVGKGAARAVRREGRVPAVIYGGGAAPEAISLDGNETRHLILAGHFLTTVFNVDVEGSTTQVIPRDYQLDPVKDTPLHVDFLRVSAGQTVSVEVPVHFVGQDASPGLKAGGTLNVVRHAIELTVPADNIPDAIEVNLAGAALGDSIHISAVKLPVGAKPVIDRDFTIATIAVPASLGAAAEAEAQAAATAATAASPKGDGKA
ncbi:MAG: 50S ribosomal protein L25/general stress protein Ctc [Methylobacteriaceae bacterium]|nr:50S ribosomal protein L25/general stress protein Ctc [Methylobacteriaceae bacterium]